MNISSLIQFIALPCLFLSRTLLLLTHENPVFVQSNLDWALSISFMVALEVDYIMVGFNCTLTFFYSIVADTRYCAEHIHNHLLRRRGTVIQAQSVNVKLFTNIQLFINSHAFTRGRESAYTTRNEAEVVCVRHFLQCVRWANPSLRKSKREKILSCIVLIKVANCSFRCTLSLYY